MLMPLLLHMPGGEHIHPPMQGAVNGALATVIHTAAMLATTGAIALVIYDWYDRIGLGFLRRGWINFDWIWSFALIAGGVVLIVALSLGVG